MLYPWSVLRHHIGVKGPLGPANLINPCKVRETIWEDDKVTAQRFATTALVSTLLAAITVPAMAQEIRFMCSSDGNECDVYQDILSRFEAENPGVEVVVDVVAYQAILENLPVQLASGNGPDHGQDHRPGRPE